MSLQALSSFDRKFAVHGVLCGRCEVELSRAQLQPSVEAVDDASLAEAESSAHLRPGVLAQLLNEADKLLIELSGPREVASTFNIISAHVAVRKVAILTLLTNFGIVADRNQSLGDLTFCDSVKLVNLIVSGYFN